MMQFRRDPFARTNVYRLTQTWGSCAWCGTRSVDKRNGRMYTYSVIGDSIRPLASYAPLNKPFCCVSCWDSYRI